MGETFDGFTTSHFLISPAAEKAKGRSRYVRLEKSRPQVPERTEGVYYHYATTVRFAELGLQIQETSEFK